MYLEYYGFRDKPFNPTPDPRFLYLSPSHREALAQLEYGVRERRGFIMLTGEVGTGKTTLLQTLLGRLPDTTETAFVFDSMLSFDEIVRYMLEDFGVSVSSSSQAERAITLNHFLIERRRRDLDTVLLIDEAQNLEVVTLERIRLLSNFETRTDKLLQILLVGQPELRARLALPELRQLRQRISIRAAIEPLTKAESADYVRHRLRVARGTPGVRTRDPFTPRALSRICDYGQGIPRLLNLVSDHSLLIGYADRQAEVDLDTVEVAIGYLENGAEPGRTADDGGLTTSWPGAWRRVLRWLSRWHVKVA
jgi:general secretion pathway protein A